MANICFYLNHTITYLETLVKLLIFASFFLVCCMIASVLAGIFSVGWDHIPMYLLCKDFGTEKAEGLQGYNDMQDQGLGK